ncbi:MAG: alpha/beta fold hydrolase [Gammaproteobacteria bacterium]|nr:alpha/beta fold hydrolase [Gammaproteobacteria bacterium]
MQIQPIRPALIRLGSAREEAPALVLIHGVGLDRNMWMPLAGCLGEDIGLYVYDMLGHGACPTGSTDLRLHDFVHQLEQLLAAAHLHRYALAGFSMGALVAQAHAVRGPVGLDRLILLHSVHQRDAAQQASVRQRLEQAERDGPAAIIEAALDRWFTEAFISKHPRVAAEVRHRLQRNDAAGFLAAYRVFAGRFGLGPFALDRIDCPTLVATGELDSGSTPAMSRSLAALIANARYELFEGLAHLAPIEAPERVADSVRRFVLSAG